MSEPPLGNRHLEELLCDVCDTLDAAQIQYAIIGGIALSVWGEPRTTFDIDLIVAVPPSEIDRLCDVFRRSPKFLMDPSVCPMPRMTLVRVHQVDHEKTPAELLLADLLVFEDDSSTHIMARRRKGTFSGREFWFCSPEDLIILKLVAGRPRDTADIFAVLRQMGDELDFAYLDERVGAVGRSLEWEALTSQWRKET